MPVAPTSGVVSEGVRLPPLQTGLQTVWSSPYHTGLARQRLRRLHNTPRFPVMLWSLALSRPGQTGGPKVTSSQTFAPCRGDPTPSETAHPLRATGSHHPAKALSCPPAPPILFIGWLISRLDRMTPSLSLHPHYQASPLPRDGPPLCPTTGTQSLPVSADWDAPFRHTELAAVAPHPASGCPFSGRQVPRSVQEPKPSSRHLHAGHRLASNQVSARLIPG
jgi:hypothetical protein